jgi:hypothetical protein
MSADLFAIFGAPTKPTADKSLDDTWSILQGGPVVTNVPQAQLSKSGDGDVLFDADSLEAEAEDDFGDFEDVNDETVNEQILNAGPVQKQAVDKPSVVSISQQVDLLDLGNDVAPEPIQQHYAIPSIQATKEKSAVDEADEWGDFEDFSQDAQPEPKAVVQSNPFQTPIQATTVKSTSSLSPRNDETWDEFEDWNSEQTPAEYPADGITSTNPLNQPEIPSEPRPTNIPPPTILLQLLPDVFQSLQTQAKTSTISSSPSSTTSLATQIITVFAVSARIIACRTLRYKRDTHLSQSTRIGPSTAGSRSGGMKLVALNKTETLHSEREAAAVCDAWSRNTHIFAGVVGRSEHRRPWMNLNVNMSVRAGPGYGTLEAREACALCGIRREERIAGVDFDADDVFGEYWTEWWGHTDCRTFWYTYRDMLQQR